VRKPGADEKGVDERTITGFLGRIWGKGKKGQGNHRKHQDLLNILGTHHHRGGVPNRNITILARKSSSSAQLEKDSKGQHWSEKGGSY